MSETFKTAGAAMPTMGSMRIGIGLPAAVPGATGPIVGRWAEQAERQGFRSVSVIDRLVYDNLDPLVALGAAAARTERIELLTTVLNVGYRRNPTVLAKQLASVEQLSAGRLTAGLALGGWPEDYAASDVPLTKRGALFDATVAAIKRAWAGELTGAGGPMPALPHGRPGLLLGGLTPASFARAAREADGWVAPSFGFDTLVQGMTAVRKAWTKPGRPRVVVERYFCLGAGADRIAEHYLEHYYGKEYAGMALADTLTSRERLHEELGRLAEAGCDDVILLPCSGDLDQVSRLATALERVGYATAA